MVLGWPHISVYNSSTTLVLRKRGQNIQTELLHDLDISGWNKWKFAGTYNIFDNVRYLDLIFKNMTFYLHLKIQNINANAISLTFSRWPWLNNVILKDLNTKHILTMQYDVRDMFPEYLICKFEKITDALVPTYTFY